jgi:hypothetical protein
LAGFDFQSSGVLPSLIAAFSSRELCCLGADTIVASLSRLLNSATNQARERIIPGAFGMRVYGPRDIADEGGDRDGAARLLARRSLLFHRELFEVPFRHADREACMLPQLAIF